MNCKCGRSFIVEDHEPCVEIAWSPEIEAPEKIVEEKATTFPVASLVYDEREQRAWKTWHLVALAGTAAILLGMFCPFAQAPFFGPIMLVSIKSGVFGVFVGAAVVVSGIGIAKQSPTCVLASAIITVIMIGTSWAIFVAGTTNVLVLIDGPEQVSLLNKLIQFSWGLPILVAGNVALFVAVVLSKQR